MRRVGGVGSTHLSCRRQMMLRALPLLLWQQQLLLSAYERCSSIADLQRKKKTGFNGAIFSVNETHVTVHSE